MSGLVLRDDSDNQHWNGDNDNDIEDNKYSGINNSNK